MKWQKSPSCGRRKARLDGDHAGRGRGEIEEEEGWREREARGFYIKGEGRVWFAEIREFSNDL